MKSYLIWKIYKKRRFFLLTGTLFSFLIVLVSCSLDPQWQFTFSSQPEDAEEKASLILNISSGFQAKTLLPDIDMNPFNYDFQGSGPMDSSFNGTTEETTVEFTSLDPGDWIVTVNAKNIDGTVISTGKENINLKAGNKKNLDIEVKPVAGHGTLDIAVYWTPDDVTDSSIIAQLTPATGSPMDLNFTLGSGSATCVDNTIPTGYHTLEIRLLDNGILVMGAVEVVRIVNKKVTSGVFEFFDINQPGGDIVINITPNTQNPIEVVMDGQLPEILLGQSMTVTASAPQETENTFYVWYINGESMETGASYTVGSELAAGFYRLDVTAFSTDGKRAGSATHNFNVIESAQVTLEWDANTEPDLDGYKLYYGTSSGNYTNIIDVGNQVNHTVAGLTPGETYYFAATAYNTAGYESDYSNEITYTVPL